MVFQPQALGELGDARPQDFETAGIVLGERFFSPDDVQRGALLRRRFGHQQRAVGEIKRRQADAARHLRTPFAPPKSTRDHQVEDHENVALELPDDAFAETAQAADNLAIDREDRRVERSHQERTLHPGALERPTDDAGREALDVQVMSGSSGISRPRPASDPRRHSTDGAAGATTSEFGEPLGFLGHLLQKIGGLHPIAVLGLELDQIRSGLESFSGVDRRFQVKADAAGILVVDDYGHHPTEIRATLATAKDAFARRTVVIFQPHRFSRVEALFEEFCRAFHQADVLVVTEIYPAGEQPRPGVSGERLAEGIKEHGHRHVRFVSEIDDVPDALRDTLEGGDLVLTLGAGSVTTVSDKLAEVVRERG